MFAGLKGAPFMARPFFIKFEGYRYSGIYLGMDKGSISWELKNDKSKCGQLLVL